MGERTEPVKRSTIVFGKIFSLSPSCIDKVTTTTTVVAVWTTGRSVLTSNRFNLRKLWASLLFQFWVGKSCDVRSGVTTWLVEFLIEETCDVGVKTKLVNKSGIKRYNEGVIPISMFTLTTLHSRPCKRISSTWQGVCQSPKCDEYKQDYTKSLWWCWSKHGGVTVPNPVVGQHAEKCILCDLQWF